MIITKSKWKYSLQTTISPCFDSLKQHFTHQAFYHLLPEQQKSSETHKTIQTPSTTWIARLRPRRKPEQRRLRILRIPQPHKILHRLRNLGDSKRLVRPIQPFTETIFQKAHIFLHNFHNVPQRTAIFAQFLLSFGGHALTVSAELIRPSYSPGPCMAKNGGRRRHWRHATPELFRIGDLRRKMRP